MAGDDGACLIQGDRIRESERFYTVGNVSNLPFRVSP